MPARAERADMLEFAEGLTLPPTHCGRAQPHRRLYYGLVPRNPAAESGLGTRRTRFCVVGREQGARASLFGGAGQGEPGRDRRVAQPGFRRPRSAPRPGTEENFEGIYIHRIADGKITEEWSQANTLHTTLERLEQEMRDRERVEHELRVAQRIQHALLPTDLPKLEGWSVAHDYRPAREVGGDFYDFLSLDDGRVGVVIGDVSGKGISAALVMACTQSVLRAVAQRVGITPGRALEETNDVLFAYIPPNMFATCFYAVFDPTNGRLQYANAGHSLPCRWHEGLATDLRASGMPLGLMSGMTYEERVTVLLPGDGVLFYSDGLIEAHDQQREMFGIPRMEEFVVAHPGGAALVESLLAELEQFTGVEREQEDDITLLTLQRFRAPH